MKKILSLSLVIIMIMLCFVSCGKEIVPQNENNYTNYDGVYITIKSVDTTGEYRKLEVEWNNETEYRVYCKNEFFIEKKTAGEWMNTKIAMVEFADEERFIYPLGNRDETYTTEYFDISDKGTYRIRVEFTVQESEETGIDGTAWVVFQVE